MSFPENQYSEHQLSLRAEALEKEVQRLRSASYRQSVKISNVRRTLFFSSFFFVSLFLILLLKGLIQLPSKKAAPQNIDALVSLKVDSVLDEKSKVREDSIYQLLYKTHPAAIPKENYRDVIFSIQIGAYTGIDLAQFKTNLLGIKQDSYEGINQFTLGEFTDHDEAVSFLSVVQQMGFHDAFIMSFKNGRRIPLQLEFKMPESVDETGGPSNSLIQEVDIANVPDPIAEKETTVTESNDGIQM